MKHDIINRTDIELLVNEFYTKVKKDEVIGFFFTEIVQLSWEKHIPIMYNFWESVLLGQASYKGNPINAHIDLDKKSRLTKVHFEQWRKLWESTIDTLFEGKIAQDAKHRAELMEHLMLSKIEASHDKNFIQ